MDCETLRRVQLAQLGIAKEIKRVCDENEINYFLDSGSLIGAIRHKGFIPWDDDMDIGMLRNDYERFLEIAPLKLSQDYFLQTWYTDEHYPLPFSKIRKKGTVYAEATSVDSFGHRELFVDVLPYDEMPKEKKLQKRIRRQLFTWCRTFFVKDGIKPWKHHENKLFQFASMCRYLPFKALAVFYSREAILNKCLKVMKRYDGNNTGLVYEQWGDLSGRHPVPSEYFASFIEVPFENELFKVPEKYDGVLRAQYGDYMKLPPENQRENRHKVLDIKL